MDSIEVRVTNPDEQFAMAGREVVTAEPGDVLLVVELSGQRALTLLDPEAARRLGMDLVQHGSTGLRRRYGAVEALKRILNGTGTAPRPTEGPHHA